MNMLLPPPGHQLGSWEEEIGGSSLGGGGGGAVPSGNPEPLLWEAPDRGLAEVSRSPLGGEEASGKWPSGMAQPSPPAAWGGSSLLQSCGPFIFAGSSEPW